MSEINGASYDSTTSGASYDKDLEELESMLGGTSLPEDTISNAPEPKKVSKRKEQKTGTVPPKKIEPKHDMEETDETGETNNVKEFPGNVRVSIFNKAKLFIKQRIYVFFGIVFALSALTLSIIKPSFIMSDITPLKPGEEKSKDEYDPKQKKLNMMYVGLVSIFISAVISTIAFVYLKNFNV